MILFPGHCWEIVLGKSLFSVCLSLDILIHFSKMLSLQGCYLYKDVIFTAESLERQRWNLPPCLPGKQLSLEVRGGEGWRWISHRRGCSRPDAISRANPRDPQGKDPLEWHQGLRCWWEHLSEICKQLCQSRGLSHETLSAVGGRLEGIS